MTPRFWPIVLEPRTEPVHASLLHFSHLPPPPSSQPSHLRSSSWQGASSGRGGTEGLRGGQTQQQHAASSNNMGLRSPPPVMPDSPLIVYCPLFPLRGGFGLPVPAAVEFASSPLPRPPPQPSPLAPISSPSSSSTVAPAGGAWVPLLPSSSSTSSSFSSLSPIVALHSTLLYVKRKTGYLLYEQDTQGLRSLLSRSFPRPLTMLPSSSSSSFASLTASGSALAVAGRADLFRCFAADPLLLAFAQYELFSPTEHSLLPLISIRILSHFIFSFFLSSNLHPSLRLSFCFVLLNFAILCCSSW